MSEHGGGETALCQHWAPGMGLVWGSRAFDVASPCHVDVMSPPSFDVVWPCHFDAVFRVPLLLSLASSLGTLSCHIGVTRSQVSTRLRLKDSPLALHRRIRRRRWRRLVAVFSARPGRECGSELGRGLGLELGLGLGLSWS